MSTLKDVAALAGVSTAAISLYLNGKADGRVSPQKQQEIEAAIQQLSYKSSKVSQRLRNIDSDSGYYTIAIYWASDYRSNLLGKVISGLQSSVLKNESENINIVICPYAVDSLYKERGFLQRNLYDAAIIANSSPSDMQYLDSITPEIPVVLLNRYLEQYHTVKINNHKMGSYIAQLIAERGFKNVAVFRTLSPYYALIDRVTGFLEGCREHNLNISNDFMFITESTIDGGIRAAEDFIQRSSKPDVLFCDSDAIALGALYVFNKNGLHIPEDFSVIAIGLHNSSATQCSFPALTVSEVPLREMAEGCMDLALNVVLNKPDSPKHIELDTSITFRESFI